MLSSGGKQCVEGPVLAVHLDVFDECKFSMNLVDRMLLRETCIKTWEISLSFKIKDIVQINFILLLLGLIT